ncbi:MAG: hypothetical protein ABEK10_03805 [Candidatus Nanosalina sp.]
MSFLLDFMDKLKPDEEEEEGQGFPDMNYVVGNTSGMDVGNIPTPLDQRVGDQAQLGGSVMEVQVYNPGTFSVEREELLNSINQLGIDISLHSDPNSGFTSAYKTRGQQATGYEAVHNYFTNYLNELAIFKREKENREELDFEITRINPHASTSPLPAQQERMASDVGLDPFGHEISELDRDDWKRRSSLGHNIFDNEEFLRRFYYTFVKRRTVDQLWRLFLGRQGVFTNYSAKFDRIFRDAQRQACDRFYHNVDQETEDKSDKLEAKMALVSSAGRADVGVQSAWLNQIEEELPETFDEVYAVQEQDPEGGPMETRMVSKSVEKLSDLNKLLPPNVRITSINRLAEAIYRIENEQWNDRRIDDFLLEGEELENFKDVILKAIEDRLDRTWEGPNGDKFLISVQGKIQALSNHLDIEGQRIYDLALHQEAEDFESDDDESWEIDEAAEEVISGNDDFFEDEEEEERNRYREMLKTLLGNFEQMLWMESNIFYYIIPVWMKTSSYSSDRHDGWEAPEFIWDVLIQRKWGEDYDIDLKDPEKDDGYFDALENEEFRMDVAGAVGACYIWGHFTQNQSQFEIKDEEHVEAVEKTRCTWMEWMNRFGIGVNLEAMHGSPQQLLKVWRPKDIVAAVRAVNLTARNELEEIHPDLDDCIAKFTIDMEHVASFGVDPWKQMKELIEQERELADSSYDVMVNEEKPLAKILRNYHLMKPGLESQQGTRHGPFDRGDKTLYTWLYRLVDAGFARNPGEVASVMYEQGDEKAETTYMARITMDMIELGIEPDEVDPVNVPTDGDYSNRKEALIAKFFGMDESSTAAEWAKIEQHAFDPLKGLLEAEEFDYTFSSAAAIRNDTNPREWQNEEYR